MIELFLRGPCHLFNLTSLTIISFAIGKFFGDYPISHSTPSTSCNPVTPFLCLLLSFAVNESACQGRLDTISTLVNRSEIVCIDIHSVETVCTKKRIMLFSLLRIPNDTAHFFPRSIVAVFDKQLWSNPHFLHDTVEVRRSNIYFFWTRPYFNTEHDDILKVAVKKKLS